MIFIFALLLLSVMTWQMVQAH